MSIVYLAYNLEDVRINFCTGTDILNIKIGQTENSDVRASQLKRKGEYIDKYVEVPNNATVRMYIESCIRLKISNSVANIHNGYDHFTINQRAYRTIADHFEEWVYEALKGID